MDTSSSSESDFEVLDLISNISIQRNSRNRKDPFEIYSDREFKTKYRLDKHTVAHINDMISATLAPVSHRKYRLTALEQIFITLRFYATGTFQIIGDINVHKTTMSRVVYKVSKEIAKLAKYYITMPTSRELRDVKAYFFTLAGFPNVIGCVDGTHIPIKSPGGNKAKLFRYNKGYSINVQIVCDGKLNIRDIDARWYGSVPDIIVYQNSLLRIRLDNNELDGYLLGDSAYACSKYMMTPIKNPTSNPEKLYNEAHTKTRKTVDRTIGIWKKRFPCLTVKLRLKLQHTLAVIVATAVLHNICKRQNDTFIIDYSEDVAQNNIGHNFPEEIEFRQLLVQQYFSPG